MVFVSIYTDSQNFIPPVSNDWLYPGEIHNDGIQILDYNDWQLIYSAYLLTGCVYLHYS